MGLFDHFPYTNVHELNLDWILSMMRALEAEWESFTAGNSLTFADPLQHDISKTYAKNTIVLDNTGNAYVSLQAVPVGVPISNSEYWLMVFDYEAFIEKVNKNFTARYYRGQYRATAAMAIGDWLTVDDILYKATAAIAVDDIIEVGVNITHFTLEDFIKAFMQSANDRITQMYDDFTAAEAQHLLDVQAEIDRILAGATVDSEVIDARTGAYGETYTTLGVADRTQFQVAYNFKNTDNFFVALGSIDSSGNPVASTVAATTNYVRCFTAQTITVDTPYRIDVVTYNADGTFRAKHNSWESSIAISPDYIYRLIFKKADNTDFDLTDFPALITSSMSAFIYYIDNDYVENKVDYLAAEIEDAREGVNGETYGSLGDAIRDQIDLINYFMQTNEFFAEYGSIDGSGNLVDSYTAVRTNWIKCDTNQTLTCDSTYRFDVVTYDPDGTFHSKGGSWVTSKTIVPNYYYRILIKKNDNTNFNINDLPSVFTSDLTVYRRYVYNDYLIDLAKDAIKLDTLYNFTKAAGLEVEIGSLSGTGALAIANNRLRSNYFQISSAITLSVDDSSIHRISIYWYDKNGKFMGYAANQTSYTISDTDRLYRIVAYFSNNRVVNKSMFNQILTNDLSSCTFFTTNTDITTNYKPLRGLTFSVLGDSISSYDGYVPSGYRTLYPSGDVDSVDKMYWKLLADEEGMSVDIINAFSGSTVGTKWQPDALGPRIPFIDNERLTNLGTDPDVIIIYGGTNDVSGNPLGNDYIEDGVYTDLYEFKHAYAYMLDQVKQLYPTSKILCVAIADKDNPSYIESGLYPPKQLAVLQPLASDTTTHFLYEFNDVIKELCNRYSCVYVDIRDCFNYYNLVNECVDPTGKTHPNAFGHYKIKEKIKQALIENYGR